MPLVLAFIICEFPKIGGNFLGFIELGPTKGGEFPMGELYIKGIQGQWEVTFWVYKAHVRSLNGNSPRVLAFDI